MLDPHGRRTGGGPPNRNSVSNAPKHEATPCSVPCSECPVVAGPLRRARACQLPIAPPAGGVFNAVGSRPWQFPCVRGPRIIGCGRACARVGGGLGVHHFHQVSRLSLYGHTGVLGSGRSPLVQASSTASATVLACGGLGGGG